MLRFLLLLHMEDAMSKEPELPEVLYVAWEPTGETDGSCFLNAATGFGEMAELNSQRRVGVYELKRTRIIINQSKLAD